MNIEKTNSLVELFFKKLEEVNKEKPFLRWLKNKNESNYTWEEVSEKIFKLSNKIKSLIKKGDRCLLLSENRPEWLIADIAIMNAGGISVPIFTTYAADDYGYIINNCKPSLFIISNNQQFEKVKNYIHNKNIISFEKIKSESYFINDIYEEKLKKEINFNLKREMPACIIYTSGTSGNPKGVVLSHGGILSNCEGALSLLNPLIKKKKTNFLNLASIVSFIRTYSSIYSNTFRCKNILCRKFREVNI